jgi:hypothetical protein
MFGKRVVHSAEEAPPKPGIVFGSEIGSVIREELGGGWGGEDLWRM